MSSFTRRGFHRAATALVAGAALGGTAVPRSAAAATGRVVADQPPTVLLVHGVFAGSSSWNGVIPLLQRSGYPVLAAANPLRDLAGDSAYVSSIIDTIPGPVILVGHSYGGAVITNAAREHDNVKALVYVAAFAPDAGESPLALTDKFPGSQLSSALITRPFPLPDGSTGYDGYVDPARFHEVFAADLTRSTAALMAVTQRPGSVGGLAGLSGAPAWKNLPSWYVIPAADQVIPPAAQRYMAQRAGSRVVEVRDASHVVMLSRPETVLRQIEAAAYAVR
ncbi:alpha/beta fold hydrolase [Micromonospora sp. MS34]|uniref:alpha/beta fold hydrolase n=1 Tax=Micromonospora sp. MS34 TaxID=3385971 RepID=UPI0039A39178